MRIYRIVKSRKRAMDLSGTGAFHIGGRWNNPGTYMLYTSENSSLAYLENLVHFDADVVPPHLYIIEIDIPNHKKLVYELPDKDYPAGWQLIGNLETRSIGDALMAAKKSLAVKVRSAVNSKEYNLLLNPLFPGYHDLVKIISIEPLPVDKRLIK